ncbi:ABC-type molybdenum transport system, ATPase component/photorepair protein PhrA [Desulfocurvibacter africanus PCS]|uniref:ABC-type molybdenum transport system, ATPase component/photorepair protein PhrA n=1 Tax=Desulfocurvibacter africanus PCS TaxID=1262666 RepID=M5Q0G2_DESAF|nr:ATP-binding cassette domain-containing protein [Desulfocurvibacter africanus]EMG35648.1 ABC-type molybdenum transport system, ATPase component/photorepair protein PhrA [Desulfocurvibacter africanus PCS]
MTAITPQEMAQRCGGEAEHPLVCLDGCTVRMTGCDILTDVRLTLRAGQGWVVLGGNGAGKSTLLKLLRGDVWPVNPDCRQFFSQDGPSASPIGFREHTALVSAELAEEYRRLEFPLTGRECALTGLWSSRFLAGPVATEHVAHVEGLFRSLDLEELLERPMAVMSEGQAKAVLLVRGLVAKPRVLFLDEAFDGLDTERRAVAIRLVAEIAAHGVSVVQATHRSEEIVTGLRMGLLLEHGRVVFAGELARALDAYAGCDSAWPCAPAAEAARDDGPVQPAVPIVELRNASVSFAGQLVLREANFALRPGEQWGLVGPNGAGKSTLLKLLAGDLYPMPGGEVLRHGQSEPHDLWQVRREVGYVSAELQACYDPQATGLETVISGLRGSVGLYAPPDEEEEAAAKDLLNGSGLQELASRRLERMSFGQRRKLMILRAMVHRPLALLLDEPLSGLDLASREEVRIFLEGLRTVGVALVIVSHHEQDLPRKLDGQIRLEAGRLLAGRVKGQKALFSGCGLG